MSVGPILPGRLPSSMLSKRLQQNLETSSRILTQLNDQLSSGQKFFLPSEAPAAAIRSIILQKTLERKQQMQTNIETDRSMLSASESSLSTVSDLLNQAKAFVVAGIGNSATDAEREGMATEVASMLQAVVNVGNTKFRGRYLFGGSQSQQLPFELVGGSSVRYNGDTQSTNSFVDLELLLANNVDGDTAFGALTKPVGNDINPALTAGSKIGDLLGGQGVQLGSVTVSLNGAAQTQTVDLSGAETIGDLKTRLENAFAGGPATLTVSINSSNNGLQLTSSTGNIVVSNVAGSTVASDLGIAGSGASQVVGTDLDPRLTIHTALSALNGGTGIGSTSGTGLLINNGTKSKVVDLNGAVTVEDALNRLKAADLDLSVGINEAGNGLKISSRLSGTLFSIGENGGTNAAGLGIRTLDGTTPLADLNLGQGVSVDSGTNLEILLRDGTSVSIDLSGSTTVQNVLDKITAAHPSLTASLNAVGGGISITDASLVTLNTPLSSLQGGAGVPLGPITVSLNGGAETQEVDLSGATTLDDVKNKLEAAFASQPVTLSVAINGSGNGLTLTSSTGDVSVADLVGSTVAAKLGIAGVGTPLVGGDVNAAIVIDANSIATELGIAGKQGGGGASVTLAGAEINSRETNGAISLLARLQTALLNGDNAELTRLGQALDAEILRFNTVRGDIGNRLKTLDSVQGRLEDEKLQVNESLSKDFDTDFTEVISQLAFKQQTMEAALQVAGSTLRLSLLAYL